MGHWEWERGEFKLPTAAFATVRAAVEKADRGEKEMLFEHTQKFWGSLKPGQKRNTDSYRQAVREHVAGVSDWGMRRRVEDLIGLNWRRDKPSRVLKSDMDYPTSRTLDFVGADFGIHFDRSTSSVSFGVTEGKGTVERAHQSPVFGALMRQVDGMRWTRGTGGRTWSDDEYAEDARQEHGYAAELTSAGYGPIGAQNWPMQTRPWKDPKGDTFHVKITATKHGMQGRVQKGVPAGGQFSGRYRPDSAVSLGSWR